MTSEELDRADPRPLYAQLRDAVAGQIAGHTLLPGDALPTEHELAQRYGVARSVVRQALAELAEQGWIHRRRGRGGVVARTGDYRREVQRAGGLDQQMAAAGRNLRTELVDVRRARPPAAAREALQTAETWQVERLRWVDDEPVVLVRTWLPVRVFPRLDRGRLASTGLHDLMRAHGFPPAGGRRHVQAVPADEYVAGRLAVGVGEPLLLLEGVTRDAEGRGLEWFGNWHRPNTVFDIDARVGGDDTGVDDVPRPEPVEAAGDDRLSHLHELVGRLAAEIDRLRAGPEDGPARPAGSPAQERPRSAR